MAEAKIMQWWEILTFLNKVLNLESLSSNRLNLKCLYSSSKRARSSPVSTSLILSNMIHTTGLQSLFLSLNMLQLAYISL